MMHYIMSVGEGKGLIWTPVTKIGDATFIGGSPLPSKIGTEIRIWELSDLGWEEFLRWRGSDWEKLNGVGRIVFLSGVIDKAGAATPIGRLASRKGPKNV